uniref:Protein YIPF n=1 Tax=Parastrongyloides trichosuri TaxID=131310 RepID=A0A0N4ZPW5_PARTI
MDGNNWYDQNQWQNYSQPMNADYNNYQINDNSMYGGNMFIPPQQEDVKRTYDDIENEPPLLEELGINFDHIKQKTLSVLNPRGTSTADVIHDQDLAGPLVFCLLFGFSLLLHGKMQFGFIYGMGGIGTIGMYLLLNLMADPSNKISFTCTASVLGYCLLPMALLSFVAAVLSLQGFVGYVMSSGAVLWCSSSSSKWFTIALDMHEQRFLVAYPCVLLYGVFALLAIF